MPVVDDEVGAGEPQQLDEPGDGAAACRADRHRGRSAADASLRRPRRAAVLAMPIGSNQAISSAIVVVASLISLSSPPMIPPMPIGVSLASQISRSSVGERALDARRA